MDNYTALYWLTRLDGINNLVLGFGWICLVVALIVFIASRIGADFDEFHHGDELLKRIDARGKFTKKIKPLIIWGACLITISVFLPTKNDMILIYAGGKTMDYVQSDTSLQKIPYQTIKIISDYLEKQIEEVKDK